MLILSNASFILAPFAFSSAAVPHKSLRNYESALKSLPKERAKRLFVYGKLLNVLFFSIVKRSYNNWYRFVIRLTGKSMKFFNTCRSYAQLFYYYIVFYFFLLVFQPSRLLALVNHKQLDYSDDFYFLSHGLCLRETITIKLRNCFVDFAYTCFLSEPRLNNCCSITSILLFSVDIFSLISFCVTTIPSIVP